MPLVNRRERGDRGPSAPTLIHPPDLVARDELTRRAWASSHSIFCLRLLTSCRWSHSAHTSLLQPTARLPTRHAAVRRTRDSRGVLLRRRACSVREIQPGAGGAAVRGPIGERGSAYRLVMRVELRLERVTPSVASDAT